MNGLTLRRTLRLTWRTLTSRSSEGCWRCLSPMYESLSPMLDSTRSASPNTLEGLRTTSRATLSLPLSLVLPPSLRLALLLCPIRILWPILKRYIFNPASDPNPNPNQVRLNPVLRNQVLLTQVLLIQELFNPVLLNQVLLPTLPMLALALTLTLALVLTLTLTLAPILALTLTLALTLALTLYYVTAALRVTLIVTLTVALTVTLTAALRVCFTPCEAFQSHSTGGASPRGSGDTRRGEASGTTVAAARGHGNVPEGHTFSLP